MNAFLIHSAKVLLIFCFYFLYTYINCIVNFNKNGHNYVSLFFFFSRPKLHTQKLYFRHSISFLASDIKDFIWCGLQVGKGWTTLTYVTICDLWYLEHWTTYFQFQESWGSCKVYTVREKEGKIHPRQVLIIFWKRNFRGIWKLWLEKGNEFIFLKVCTPCHSTYCL